MSQIDREEKLGRSLCDVYGGIVTTFPETTFPETQSGFTILVDIPECAFLLYFRNWHELLFGSDKFNNLNHYLLFFNVTKHVIEYSSLDELELQLTLMGRTPR